jgi:hypothetical protein
MSDFAISAATASDAPILLHHRRAMFVDMGRDEDAIELMAHAAAATPEATRSSPMDEPHVILFP